MIDMSYGYGVKCKTCGAAVDVLLDGECEKCNPQLAGILADRREFENQKRKLYYALRSRVLSDEEMAQVEEFDFRLIVFIGEAYNEAEKRAEFNAALLQQFKIRLAAGKGKS